jgi:hypothetical protein
VVVVELVLDEVDVSLLVELELDVVSLLELLLADVELCVVDG